MNESRRTMLKECGAGGMTMIASAVGLLPALPAAAAPRHTAGFASKSLPEAMANIGAGDAIESAEIVIAAPDIAENGVLIPIEVTSRIPGTESIALLVEKNPFPLLAYFRLSSGADGYVNTRFKAGQSSVVKAVVKAGGKTYVASREVKVTIGGCGG